MESQRQSRCPFGLEKLKLLRNSRRNLMNCVNHLKEAHSTVCGQCDVNILHVSFDVDKEMK
eukprot:m.309561 g.309561  ORF g.309561 m.309561 type:complete len:61 (+) comp46951_c0_seq1:661-843(+)